jgi:uncharacterized protein YegP (UPF0339 family)
MIGSFEFYQDGDAEWRWRRRASGSIVQESPQAFRTRKAAVADAGRECQHDSWQFLGNEKTGWRWVCTARNGAIAGTSLQQHPTLEASHADAMGNGWAGPAAP